MKQRMIQTIFALVAIVSSATAQTLSVESVEAKPGEQTELVISARGMSDVTALQFNLALPEGTILDESAITKGVVVGGHTLSVQTMDNGNRLFVLYNMDLGQIGDGILLRLPITLGQQAGCFSGSLYTVRTANTEAESHMCATVNFSITVKAPVQQGDANGDGTVDATDIVEVVNYILNKPSDKFKEDAADANGDGVVNAADIIAIVNIIMSYQDNL